MQINAITGGVIMYKKEYAAHKKSLVERAMMLSVEGLQHAIIGELQKAKEDEPMSYLTFDAMTVALERKMGRKGYAAWLTTL